MNTIGKILKTSTKKLEQAGITTARLDCLVLLEDAIGKDRAWLLAHPEATVQGSTLYSFTELVERRAAHEPLAYLRGLSEFYGREFSVNAHTLEPRPETETMIELLIKLAVNQDKQKTGGKRQVTNIENYHILDIGTGSGCIAVTAQLELPSATVLATDIDTTCIKTAQTNATRLRANVTFYTGNLLEPVLPALNNVKTKRTIVLANLPYVPENHTINQAAMHEPKHAIFGGPDGLNYYRQLFTQTRQLRNLPQYIFTESLPFQHESIRAIAKPYGYAEQTVQDFIQVFTLSNTSKSV